jgi:hypothetical protein
MDESDREFRRALHEEKIRTQNERAEYVTRKLAFITVIFGISSVNLGIEIADIYWLLYFIPLVAICYDLYIMSADSRIKRIGVFLGRHPVSETERMWEKFCASHRDSLAPSANMFFSVIVTVAAAIFIRFQQPQPNELERLLFASWLAISFAATVGLWGRHRIFIKEITRLQAINIPHQAINTSHQLASYLVNYWVPTTFSLKGQLHCHSTNSDGLQSPIAVVTAYRDAGYDFVSVTDHHNYTADPGIAGIIYLKGRENDEYHHIELDDCPSFEILGHPAYNVFANWALPSTWSNAISIYNAYSMAHAASDSYVDSYATEGKGIVFVAATDDNHNILDSYFNKAWVMVNVNEKTSAAILKALAAGNFYASNGNTISSISISGMEVTITCPAASNIYFIGANGHIYQINLNVITATYTMLGSEKYIRIQLDLVADTTKKAWSQLIYLS